MNLTESIFILPVLKYFTGIKKIKISLYNGTGMLYSAFNGSDKRQYFYLGTGNIH